MHSLERNEISNSLHGLLHECLGLAPVIILQFPRTKHSIHPFPPISCEFEYAWAITCTLHSHACQPQTNKRNVSKPQLSHKNMVLGFHTLWNFLPPSVSFYSNAVLTVSRTNVQAWSLGARPDFSWRWQSIPYVFQILTKKKKTSQQLTLIDYFSQFSNVSHSFDCQPLLLMTQTTSLALPAQHAILRWVLVLNLTLIMYVW